MTATETAESANAFLRDLDDAMFKRIYLTARSGGDLRDGNGNLRELTDAEERFLADTQAEWVRRGLSYREVAW